MNWETFFKEMENRSVPATFYSNNTGLTIEMLYQAFKARLMSEVEAPYQNGKLMDINRKVNF